MRVFPYVIGILLYFSKSMLALPTVVPDPIACVVELETRFFVSSIVNQGLSLYRVRQELWMPINESLRQRSLEVPDRMKKKTAYMVPNPLEYPMQKAATAKILKEVLFEVFTEALRENYVTGGTVDLIFEYIFNEQLPNFIKCFGIEANKAN
jgi:hypothetical protein